MTALVGVIMGSDSDWPVMSAASEALAEFDVPHEVRVLSAHRTPREMLEWASAADGRGLRVVVAGAGGAAHLPGMVASMTPLPVIGVPVPLTHLDGMDSLLSIVQMPAGVPVKMRSPGRSSTIDEILETSSGTEKIRSSVLPSCMTWPLSSSVSPRSCGSGTSSVVTR